MQKRKKIMKIIQNLFIFFKKHLSLNIADKKLKWNGMTYIVNIFNISQGSSQVKRSNCLRTMQKLFSIEYLSDIISRKKNEVK